jgi:MFS family permease
VLGRLGWGVTCDKLLNFNKRKTFLYIGTLFAIISLLLGLFFKYISFSIKILFSLAFLVGYTGRGWQGLYFASVSEIVKDKDNGIAVGFSSLFFRMGLMIAPPIFGIIADMRESYDLSWILLGMTLLIVSVGQYTIQNKLTKFRSKSH